MKTTPEQRAKWLRLREQRAALMATPILERGPIWIEDHGDVELGEKELVTHIWDLLDDVMELDLLVAMARKVLG